MSTASSNWLALQKKLPNTKHKTKRQKLSHAREAAVASSSPEPAPAKTSYAAREIIKVESAADVDPLPLLRKMIFGDLDYSDAHKLPGKYLSLDCEMVGVGIDGVESSLARVSLVNYYGAIQLDSFVRQRERVVDYRTQWSGVRESDMIKARPFEEVQKQVADLIEGRILVGHAVFNDLKALLLTHPRPFTRDTQYFAGKFKVTPSKYAALRNLVKQELDITIQGGEHSSVTDARATMAIYRLHRKEWEIGAAQIPKGKRKRTMDVEAEEDEDGDEEQTPQKAKQKQKQFPGGGRKGVSSGLSTVTSRGSGGSNHDRSSSSRDGGTKEKWWQQLGNGGSSKTKIRS